MNELQTNENKDIIYSSFLLKKNGLEAIGTPTFEQWQECGEFIRKAEGAVHFWIGDWTNYGEHNFGEKFTQALEHTGYDYQTLRNDAWVANKIDLSRRRDNVSWGVHAEVATFTPEEQTKLLDIAENTKATVKDIRKKKHAILLDSKRPSITLDTNLVNGNSLEYIQKMDNESIDCLITDAPYGIDYQSNRREVLPQLDKLENDTNAAFELLNKMCSFVEPKIKNNSHLYFFTSWKVYSKFESIIGRYFEIKNVIVWDKLNHGSGDLEGNYSEQYELIIFATKGRRILKTDRPSNIISYSRVANQVHPTEKPVGLIERLIETSTDEGEVVFDPFMGAGSTCLAAKNKNRKYVGVELDSQWFDIAQRRLSGELE